MSQWSPQDAESLYNVPNWSSGYFGINDAGNVVVRPDGASPEEPNGSEIDLHELIGQIRRRGVEPPILLRFDGILRARVRELNAAFANARTEYGYDAPYATVFPIKVNQQRHLVDALLEEGKHHGMGLEVGSKPELLAVLGRYAEAGRLLICNGYKDREYVETALLTTRLGVQPVIVIEKFTELDTILQVSEELGIRPALGIRTKLGGRGSGRWKDSGPPSRADPACRPTPRTRSSTWARRRRSSSWSGGSRSFPRRWRAATVRLRPGPGSACSFSRRGSATSSADRCRRISFRRPSSRVT